jgi:hypothetical protein
MASKEQYQEDLRKLRDAVKATSAVALGHNGTDMDVEWGGHVAHFHPCPGGYVVQCGRNVLVCTPDQFQAVLEALGESFLYD